MITETPRNQWPVPAWNADWQLWQQKFEDLMNGVDATSFGLLEALRTIFKSIPNARVYDDAGVSKLEMDDDLVLISRTLNTEITIDSTTPLTLLPNYMIGVVMTPGAVGAQSTALELFASTPIDPSITILGYFGNDLTIRWFNGATLMQGEDARAMFSFNDGGGGGDTYWARNAVGTPYLVPVASADLVHVGAGTAAEPGLSGHSDPDTGFFWPGSNVLGASLGGREHVRFYNDGSGMVMAVAGGGSAEFDQWDFKIIHERTHSGPPAQIQIKTIAGTNGSQIQISPTFTDSLSSGTAILTATSSGGHAQSTFGAIGGGDDIGVDRNATVYLSSSAYHGIGALYVDMYGRDQSALRINSRVFTADAYLDLCATGRTNTDHTGGYIRIGFNDDSDYRPSYIRFYSKALQASTNWSTHFLDLDAASSADWDTLYSKNGMETYSLVQMLIGLYDLTGMWSDTGSYLYPTIGASARQIHGAGFYVEGTGVTAQTGMFWNGSGLTLDRNGTAVVTVAANSKVGIGNPTPAVGLHIGSWAGLHGLNTGLDLIVSNAIELQGYLYATNRIVCGDNVSDYLIIGYRGDDGARLLVGNADGGANRHLIIADAAYNVRDFDHETLSADPTVFVHSSTDPDVDNTQYISFSHDKTYSRIQSGKGVVILGSGTPTEVSSTEDVFISGGLQTYGIIFVGSNLRIKDGSEAIFGDDSDAVIKWSTSGTNHAFMIGVSGSRNLVIGEVVDLGSFNHANSTNPTLFIQSSDAASPSDYVAIYHDQTDGRIITGAGYLAVGTGTATQSLVSGGVYVTGGLEVGGLTYVNAMYVLSSGSINLPDSAQINIGGAPGSYSDARLLWNGTRNELLVGIGTGSTQNKVTICESSDVGVDWGHGPNVNPTLYIQSADGGNVSQYVALYHDQTHGRIVTGGCLAIGTGGTPGHAGAAGDLYVQYTLEVDGTCYLDGNVQVGGDLIVDEITNLRAVSYGSAPGSASFGSGTITVNWLTGKAYQKVTISATCTASSMTAPVGATKGLTLDIWASGADRTIDATAFTDVTFKGGAGLPVTIPDGECAILTLAYDGTGYRGTIIV